MKMKDIFLEIKMSLTFQLNEIEFSFGKVTKAGLLHVVHTQQQHDENMGLQ